MASYKQLSKGNWKVVISLGYDLQGKRKRIIKQGFKTKKEAEQFVTDTLDKRNKGYSFKTNNDILFKDFIKDWLEIHSIASELAINTKNDYIGRIENHIIPIIGDYKLCDLNMDIMQDFYNTLLKSMKPVSAKKVLDIVNSCLKWAKSKKLIYDIPTEFIKKAKCSKPKIKYWNQEEVNYFLNYIKDTYLYTPIFIDVLTGLRIGELCGLRWCDVDLVNGVINVNQQLIHDKRLKVLMLADLKTPSSHRTITIPNVLITYLSELKAIRKASDNDFVVLNRNDTKYTPRNLSMNFTKKVQKFLLPKEKYKGSIPNYMQLKQITFHGLRHTHATLLIANGENIKVVSERLGHSSITMTLNTYTHVLEDMKNKTAALLDDMFK